MAREITVSISMTVQKLGAQVVATGTRVADMAGDNMLSSIQDIGTAAEPLSFGDITTIGYVVLKNLDTTNYVEIALDSGVSTQIFAKLMPGDVLVMPAKTATMYAKANVALKLLVAATEL